MPWTVRNHPEFAMEIEDFPPEAQIALTAKVRLLQQFGPKLVRPHCDTLFGSDHANMKELRFEAAGGVGRVAFAFDPKREAILLVGADKSGVSQARFYKSLIRKADQRFDDWLKG